MKPVMYKEDLSVLIAIMFVAIILCFVIVFICNHVIKRVGFNVL